MKKNFEKEIYKKIEKIMDDRNTTISSPVSNLNIPLIDDNIKFLCGIVVPIISEGDAIGSVVLYSSDGAATMREMEEKLALTASTVLVKSLKFRTHKKSKCIKKRDIYFPEIFTI